jgi:uncharacterized SAM-binding protein YcdF (DUF218 family)
MITTLFDWIILPPGIFICLMLMGLIIMPGLHRIGWLFLLTGLISLYVVSTPVITPIILDRVMQYPPFSTEAFARADPQAIVVLGAGRTMNAPEYNGETVNQETLVRLHYANYLQRQTGLPIFPVGGRIRQEGDSLAAHMQRILQSDYKAIVPWVEDESVTTYESAIFSYDVLNEKGIRRIVLVTHAWHLTRAVEAFTKAGFTVVPAPTGYWEKRGSYSQVRAWFPDIHALNANAVVMQEAIVRLWYRYLYY